MHGTWKRQAGTWTAVGSEQMLMKFKVKNVLMDKAPADDSVTPGESSTNL